MKEPQRLSPAQAEALRQEAIQLSSTNPILNAKIREYHGLVDRVVDGFDPDKLRLENPVFPENLFRACGFKDFFFGAVKDTPELALENKWMAIAGSGTNEVNVIDSSGRVLFVVPPLYDTSYLRISNYRRDDMLDEIGKNYQAQAQSMGHQANEYLGDALSAKLHNIVGKDSSQAAKHRTMLEKMYTFYGERPAGVAAATAGSAAPTSSIEDDFDLD